MAAIGGERRKGYMRLRTPAVLFFLVAAAQADPSPSSAVEAISKDYLAEVASLDSADLADFNANPGVIRDLVEKCLALTRQNLSYKYGSSDPAEGGMDCSGTIFHVLKDSGLKDAPRTASGQYVWARKADNFEAVVSRKKDSFELDDLRPGDLLFWTGTYSTERDPPVTHTMIFLGKRKRDGLQVMFGASDGRSYDGKRMNGVSVFDFTLPKAPSKTASSSGPGSVFIGYANIPGLEGKDSVEVDVPLGNESGSTDLPEPANRD